MSIPCISFRMTDASNNQLTSVANIDFRHATDLTFTGNPALATFSKVLMSSQLMSLYEYIYISTDIIRWENNSSDRVDFNRNFGTAALTTFLMDESSFRALDALPTTFRVGSIDVSGSCRLPNVPRFVKKYTICVIRGTCPRPEGTHLDMFDPSTSDDAIGSGRPSAPPNFGLIVALALGGGFVLGTAAWVMYTRRRHVTDALH
ncbi:hypothetical protein DYB28_004156 [Aphanomyces astaci]|uniref:Uncharacterized protein n=1 Tax=Aphanomyces astaci TaxID=112090 RepID=A0A9X8DVL9_APHAT|nr:hypothetical protein DYB28_004156 [Aphanomyces astaci]